MKKVLSAILICIILITYTTCVNANSKNVDDQRGFLITFNGMATEHSSVICNDKHYVPLRKIFEMMEAMFFTDLRIEKFWFCREMEIR